MFCALLTSRYQVSVYRTNGPLVKTCYPNVLQGDRPKEEAAMPALMFFALWK